uniref:Uncharacterized protein n=1 Tax=Gopherus agassizii TaxID=38772 RepID=A0A452HXV4_9SAUR
MSDSLVVCDVDPALTEKLRKFRFRKETNNAAILMKIDKEQQLVVLEEEFQVGTFHSLLPATFGKPSSVKGPAGSGLMPSSSQTPLCHRAPTASVGLEPSSSCFQSPAPCHWAWRSTVGGYEVQRWQSDCLH